MQDLKVIIGNKIHYLRELNNLNQQEFANKLNLSITRGHISNIENGVNMPSAEFIKSVCMNFHVSPNWLLNIPNENIISIDPIFERYNLLDDEAKNIIKSLISLLLNNTK